MYVYVKCFKVFSIFLKHLLIFRPKPRFELAFYMTVVGNVNVIIYTKLSNNETYTVKIFVIGRNRVTNVT
jgi:hypothetical protein